jgi:hypothetical protein
MLIIYIFEQHQIHMEIIIEKDDFKVLLKFLTAHYYFINQNETIDSV